MDIKIFYKPHIKSLFIEEFDNIIYGSENYNYELFLPIFSDLYKNLSASDITENDFIKYYYIFIFLYLSYTNYLVYSNHKDMNDPGLCKIITKIKTSLNITKNIFKFYSNDKIQQIIHLNNIFLSKKIKNNIDNNKLSTLVQTFVNEIRQYNKIYDLDNKTHKKILNLVIYRYITCIDNNYKTYHEFYINKIIDIKNNNKILDFENFINQIPKSQKLLNVSINNFNTDTKISINIVEIINFILKKYKNFYIEILEKNFIVIKNKKINGIIKIVISEKFENIEFKQFQTNYSFIHYNNLEQLKEFSFLKKSFSSLQINTNGKILSDLTNTLQFIHLFLISIKIFSNSPCDLYECIYPLEYNNYYYETFCFFLEFIKDKINVNFFYNKFIYDIAKFLFIYSYYDYYFYYSNNLINLIIDKLEFKNEIFIEFLNNLKKVLKLPKELLSYPPFFNFDFDLNSIIYYNFEMPSYFKFFDFINAVCTVFDKKKYQKQNTSNFIEILLENIFIDNKENYLNSINKTISLNYEIHNLDEKIENLSDNLESSDIKSNDSCTIDISVIYSEQIKKNNLNYNSDIFNNLRKQDIQKIDMPNTYIELNLNPNMSDFILNTEIN